MTELLASVMLARLVENSGLLRYRRETECLLLWESSVFPFMVFKGWDEVHTPCRGKSSKSTDGPCSSHLQETFTATPSLVSDQTSGALQPGQLETHEKYHHHLDLTRSSPSFGHASGIKEKRFVWVEAFRGPETG